MTKLLKPKVQMFALIRDKDGRPKVDGNPDDLPEAIKSMLTPEDWAYLKGDENAYS